MELDTEDKPVHAAFQRLHHPIVRAGADDKRRRDLPHRLAVQAIDPDMVGSHQGVEAGPGLNPNGMDRAAAQGRVFHVVSQGGGLDLVNRNQARAADDAGDHLVAAADPQDRQVPGQGPLQEAASNRKRRGANAAKSAGSSLGGGRRHK